MGKRLTTVLAVIAFLAILVGTYTAGYLWLAQEYIEVSVSGSALPGQVNLIDRVYPQQWIAIVFRPAASVEQWIRGIPVITAWRDEPLPPTSLPSGLSTLQELP